MLIPAQPGWRIVSVTTESQTSMVAEFTVRDVIAWREDSLGSSFLLPVTVSQTHAVGQCFGVISPSGQVIDWLDREYSSVDDYVACATEELLARNAEDLAEKRAKQHAA
jgi:hypothetical protein